MTDVFTRKKRSEVMSRIRGRGNLSTELRLMNLLRRHRINGWRRHSKQVPGRPDFSWSVHRLALFVDGCFWHGCRKCCHIPRNNRAFWKNKIECNRRRDRTVSRALRSIGWVVMRVWEHSLSDDPEASIRRAKELLQRCATRRQRGKHGFRAQL